MKLADVNRNNFAGAYGRWKPSNPIWILEKSGGRFVGSTQLTTALRRARLQIEKAPPDVPPALATTLNPIMDRMALDCAGVGLGTKSAVLRILNEYSDFMEKEFGANEANRESPPCAELSAKYQAWRSRNVTWEGGKFQSFRSPE